MGANSQQARVSIGKRDDLKPAPRYPELDADMSGLMERREP
jgi:hypothetical protein